MKKFFLVSVLMGVLPLSMMAQDDDLYFVPKKKSAETTSFGTPKNAYYSGSNRNVDEYNRRGSSYEVIGNDSLNDIIEFSAVQGVYPDSVLSDSLLTEDFELTKRMQRFDDYNLSSNAAFWAGYNAGLNDWGWGWHSPWYYNRYGWYGGLYDPWYYRYGFYDPWYDPFYYGYYGWYGSWYGWGSPYFYRWDYAYYPYYYAVGGGRHYTSTGNAGTINLRGGSRVMNNGSGVARNGSGRLVGTNRGVERTSSLRNRTVGSSRTTTINRSTTTRNSNNTNFNGGSRMSSTMSSGGSFGGGGSVSSGGGSVSRGGGGGGVSSGGGGARGGRR